MLEDKNTISTIAIPIIRSILIVSVKYSPPTSLSPYYYLLYLFETLPQYRFKNKEEIDKVLPRSTDMPSSCSVPKKSEVNKK